MSLKNLKDNFGNISNLNQRPANPHQRDERHASVSIVFEAPGSNLQADYWHQCRILFIKRAEREGDIWSGHMAFPGGMFDQKDSSFLATALRETKEEIGLHLDENLLIAELPIYHPRFNANLNLHPFLFALDGHVIPQNWALDRKEVEEIHWVPLSLFFQPSSFGLRSYKIRGGEFPLPTFSFNDRHVWGVTYVMLLDFLGKFVQTEMGQKILQDLNLRENQLSFWDYGPYRS